MSIPSLQSPLIYASQMARYPKKLSTREEELLAQERSDYQRGRFENCNFGSRWVQPIREDE